MSSLMRLTAYRPIPFISNFNPPTIIFFYKVLKNSEKGKVQKDIWKERKRNVKVNE